MITGSPTYQEKSKWEDEIYEKENVRVHRYTEKNKRNRVQEPSEGGGNNMRHI